MQVYIISVHNVIDPETRVQHNDTNKDQDVSTTSPFYLKGGRVIKKGLGVRSGSTKICMFSSSDILCGCNYVCT